MGVSTYTVELPVCVTVHLKVPVYVELPDVGALAVFVTVQVAELALLKVKAPGFVINDQAYVSALPLPPTTVAVQLDVLVQVTMLLVPEPSKLH